MMLGLEIMKSINVKPIGERLRYIRVERCQFDNQKKYAEMLGLLPSRYSNWENGLQIIPVEPAIAICKLSGVTLDYLYKGTNPALPDNLDELLGTFQGILEGSGISTKHSTRLIKLLDDVMNEVLPVSTNINRASARRVLAGSASRKIMNEN